MKTQLLVSALVFGSLAVQAQNSKVALTSPKEELLTTIGFSAGGNLGSIDFSRYTGNARFWGLNLAVSATLSSRARASLEYTEFPVHDALNAWENIRTRNADLNMHLTFNIESSKSVFYALAGLDLHEWKADFTGVQDINQKATGLLPHESVKVNWLGLNLGSGVNVALGPFNVFSEFRFCIVQSDLNVKLRIIDILYRMGVSYELPIYHKKGIKNYGMPGRIYKWISK